MATCQICTYAGTPSYKSPCSECKGFSKYEYEKPITNADRIRSMTDEELAKILNAFTAYFEECNRSSEDTDCHDCELCWLCSLGEGKALEWLRKPVKEDDYGQRRSNPHS